MESALEAIEARLDRFAASEYQWDVRGLEHLADLQRLSLSENSFGCSPRAAAAAAAELACLHRYPDASCTHLRAELARHHGVPQDSVLVGNGADELLLLVAQALALPGEIAVCHERTYYGHYSSLALTPASLRTLPLDRSGIAVELLLDALQSASVAFVCNPHNPTGCALNRDVVAALAFATREAGGVLVLDEAYAEFADGGRFGSGLAHVREGSVIVLRSFSKAYGLAGLRCGYAIAHPDLIDRVARARHATPFSVNRVALAAALAALADQQFLRASVGRTRGVREALRQRLGAAGVEAPESETNFLLVPSTGAACDAATVLRDRHLIHARPCDALGFPGHLRIGVPQESELDKVVAGLAEALVDSRVTV